MKTNSKTVMASKYTIKTGTPVEWVEEESYFFKPVGVSGRVAEAV